jgi:hypothetical protein
MEIIATGELREYLKTNLPKFDDPVVFISSKFIPGCPKCNSSTSVYYITLTQRKLIPQEENLEKVMKHKFPIDIFVQTPIQKPKPKKFIIGTKRSKRALEMMIRRIIE